MDRNILLDYLDFIKELKTQTNASNFQLGAVIGQEGKTIAIYSRKPTNSQRRHTVTENEPLRIVEALK